VEDRDHQARVAALSMAHCTTVANLLRAHGKHVHAESLEESLREASRIVSEAVGAEAMAEAMRWVTGQVWDIDEVLQ
jgi:hypothetical protein